MNYDALNYEGTLVCWFVVVQAHTKLQTLDEELKSQS